MAKRKRAAKKRPKKFDLGAAALLGVFVFSALFVYYPAGTAGIAFIGLLGALMAVKHIRLAEENEFLISVTAFVVVSTALLTLITGELKGFLTNLMIGFGVGGFFVALGKMVKLGWGK